MDWVWIVVCLPVFGLDYGLVCGLCWVLIVVRAYCCDIVTVTVSNGISGGVVVWRGMLRGCCLIWCRGGFVMVIGDGVRI